MNCASILLLTAGSQAISTAQQLVPDLTINATGFSGTEYMFTDLPASSVVQYPWVIGLARFQFTGANSKLTFLFSEEVVQHASPPPNCSRLVSKVTLINFGKPNYIRWLCGAGPDLDWYITDERGTSITSATAKILK